MTRLAPRPHRLSSLLLAGAVCLAVLAPSAALALPPENTTRVAFQAGWRYQPNLRFAEWAAINGHTSTGQSNGGPAFIATFGYRPLPELEVSIELGYNNESFGFVGEKSMQLSQLPITLAARYAPFGGSIYPYFGVGYGYVLNFFQDAPGGESESHGSGPTAIVGGTLEVSKRVSIFLEYRYTYCRVEIAKLGYLQAGGNLFFLGVQLAFPPEDNRLQ